MIDTNSLKTSLIDLAVSGRLSTEFQAEDSVSEIIEKLPKPSNKRKKLLGQAFEYGKQSAIPENWRWMLLGEISSYGDTPVKASISNVSDETWILDLEDIKAGGELLTKTRAKEKQFAGEKTIFHSGQVLYSKLRPYLKKVLVADENGISTPELISFDVFGGILPQYIVCCLLDSFTNRAIDKRSYGIKMPRIDAGFMVNLPVPVPPVSEQHYIIERLEAAFSLIDTIENLQIEYTSNQETLKSKLIDAAIQGKLTEQLPEDGTAEELYQMISGKKKEMQKRKEIKNSKPLPEISKDEIPFEVPSNWKWVHLDDITTKITSGSTPTGGRKSNAYVESGNCFFREQNIYNDGIHEEGMVYITDELLSTRENSTVIAKDILLNITGGSIGRCALIPDDFGKGSINQHILIIRMVDDRLRFYVHKLLCSPYAQRYIKDKSVGDKDGFSGGRCKQMLIPIPPLAEQQRIAEKIDEVLSAISMAG